jgi:hypothetical protein
MASRPPRPASRGTNDDEDPNPEAARGAPIERIQQAILDALSDDGHSLERDIKVRLVGPVRDGERWTVYQGAGSPYDVIYDPDSASVLRVVRDRGIAT